MPLTLNRNVAVFDDVGFFPRVGMALASARDLDTMVLTQRRKMPVIIAPAGIQAVWPHGDLPLPEPLRAPALRWP
ncbi:hypothetical protein ATM17_30635 (plasmid) [Sphingopyxis macrogoltabida]|uniref:FMN-dependent dehydrogenase domain-containing protein n=1 Tax=Sphingopyxis macrogoltabida TaxID=33050 RepID=A0AAC9AZ68_SPHMC|nr:hypothetical protein ATM17_30635 [Sphingopyxis macrogoltabida]